jgi:parallel beta-helix repeat protein
VLCFVQGDKIRLTAPAFDSEGRPFNRWERNDGERYSKRSIDITINKNWTFTAVYVGTVFASFEADPETGKVPLSVSFDASGSKPSVGSSISSYSWLFGDGATGSGQHVSHTFTLPGRYNVKLTVTDSGGNSSSSTRLIVVSSPIHVSLSISPDQALPDQQIQFSASGSYDQDGHITNYSWSFGDGQWATGADLVVTEHAYTASAYYIVTLTVQGSSCYSSTASRAVVIGGGGPTSVPGHTISTSTTWTTYYSPYLLQGGVTVGVGATLAIEPGVRVELGDHGWIGVDGALVAEGTSDSPIVFTSREASPEAGDWGGIVLREGCTASLRHCVVEYGGQQWISAPEGYGGIRCYSSDVVIDRCTVRENYHGVEVVGCSPTITGCTISDNMWRGIWVENESSPPILNCTIAGNSVIGIQCYGSSPNIINTIVWTNGNQQIYLDSASTVTVTYSDIQGGWEGEGNIDADPFLTPDGHLQIDSPCIDAGTATAALDFDIDGEPRPSGNAVDIGADEFVLGPDEIPPVITLLGDNPLTLECGTPYSEPGYTATDVCEGDLTADVVVTGTVDHTTLGAYVLHYDVSDASGNPAEEKTRTVNVVPVIQKDRDTVSLNWICREGMTYTIWSSPVLSTIWPEEWTEEATIGLEEQLPWTWTDPDLTSTCKFYRIELK